jgi:chromosome segregation ATPase
LLGVDEKLNRGQRQQQEQQTNIKHYETEISNIVSRLQSLYPELENQRNRISEMEEQIQHYEAQVDTFQSSAIFWSSRWKRLAIKCGRWRRSVKSWWSI